MNHWTDSSRSTRALAYTQARSTGALVGEDRREGVSIEEDGFSLPYLVSQSASSASPPPARWTRAEWQERLAMAPPFNFDAPSPNDLNRLAEEYQAITGQPIGYRQRWMFQAIVQVHGPDTLPLARLLFDSTGTTVNLLGLLRTTPPRVPEPPSSTRSVPAAGPRPAPSPTNDDAFDPDEPRFLAAFDALDTPRPRGVQSWP